MESLLVYDTTGQTPLNVVFDDLEQKLRDTEFSNFVPFWYGMVKDADTKKLKSNIPSIILSFLADNVLLVTKNDETGVNLTVNTPVQVQIGSKVLLFAKGDRVSVNGVILTPKDCKPTLFRNYQHDDLLLYGFIDVSNYRCFRRPSITAFDFEAPPTADVLLDMVEYLGARDDLVRMAYIASMYGADNPNSTMYAKPFGFFSQEIQLKSALDSRFEALQKVSMASLNVCDQDLWGVLQYEQLEYAYVMGRVFGFSSEEFFQALQQKQNIRRQQEVTANSNVSYDASKLLVLQKRIVAQRLFKQPFMMLSANQRRIVDLEVSKVVQPPEKTTIIRQMQELKKALLEVSPKNLPQLYSSLAKAVGFSSKDKPKMYQGVCAHLLIEAELRSKLRPTPENQQLIYDKIMSLAIADPSNYYCSICGEVIASNIQLQTEESASDPEQSDLKKEITQYIMTSVRIENYAKIKALIELIAEQILPRIQELETQFAKSKTSVAENVSSLIHLHTHMLAYSYVITYCLKHKLVLRFSINMTFNKASKKLQNAEIWLNSALALILREKETMIRRIGLTAAMIKEGMVNSYKYAIQHPIASEISDGEVTVDEKIQHVVDLDAIYRYNWLMLSRSKPVDLYDWAEVMGLKDVQTLSANHYAHIKEAPFDERHMSRFAFECYELALRYAKMPSYVTTPMNPIMYDFIEACRKKKEVEANVRRNSFFSARPMVHVKHISFMGDTVPILSRYYCADGKQHKIGKFVFGNVEFTNAQFIDAIKEGVVLTTARLTDFRCAKCNKLHFEPGVSNEAILKALDRLSRISEFFIYFENRCPFGGLHQFDNKTCSKCKATNEDIVEKSMQYFAKYEKQYEEVLAEYRQTSEPEPENYANATNDVTYPEYTENFANIAALSKASNVDYNVWINLGLGADHSYADIEQVRINPYNTAQDEDFIVQSQRIMIYVVRCIQFVNNLSHGKIFDAELKKLHESMGEVKFQDVLEPEFPSKVNFYRSMGNRKFANYIMDFLMRTLLRIQTHLGGDAFAYIVGSIVEAEKTACLPPPLNVADATNDDDETQTNLSSAVESLDDSSAANSDVIESDAFDMDQDIDDNDKNIDDAHDTDD